MCVLKRKSMFRDRFYYTCHGDVYLLIKHKIYSTETYIVWSLTLSTVISALMSDTVVSFKIPGVNSCPSPFNAPGDFDPKNKFDVNRIYFKLSG